MRDGDETNGQPLRLVRVRNPWWVGANLDITVETRRYGFLDCILLGLVELDNRSCE